MLSVRCLLAHATFFYSQLAREFKGASNNSNCGRSLLSLSAKDSSYRTLLISRKDYATGIENMFSELTQTIFEATQCYYFNST